MRQKINVVVILLLFSTAARCGVFFFSEYMVAQKEIKEYAGLQAEYTTTLTMNDTNNQALPEAPGLPYVLVDFEALLRENPDTVGWLAIPGTDVCYPTLQSVDNDKYLYTAFSGEHSKTGAIFMDCNNTVNPLDQNTILYGHTMQGRADMFGSLVDYNQKSFYDTHQWIQFDTIHKQYGWWRIFAVIPLDVQAGDFDCYKQNFKDAAELDAWISQAMELSLYDTGVQIPANPIILTLSTCNRSIGYGRNGRQLILAVQTSGNRVPTKPSGFVGGGAAPEHG